MYSLQYLKLLASTADIPDITVSAVTGTTGHGNAAPLLSCHGKRPIRTGQFGGDLPSGFPAFAGPGHIDLIIYN